jgi:hypothetical protein
MLPPHGGRRAGRRRRARARGPEAKWDGGIPGPFIFFLRG